MRVLSNIDNAGTVDGEDIGALEGRITVNEGGISTNANSISSINSNLASISSTLSTKAATTDLPKGTYDGQALGPLKTISIDPASSVITLSFQSGTVDVGVIFANLI